MIVTPNFHHWHHAQDAEAIDRNYAAHFAFLDHLFGTAVQSDREWPARYGVLYHSVGLADEYPTLPHLSDWTDDTPDGVLESGRRMTQRLVFRDARRRGLPGYELTLLSGQGTP